MINTRTMQEFSNSLIEVRASTDDRITMPVFKAIEMDMDSETYDMVYAATISSMRIDVFSVTNATISALGKAVKSATIHEGTP